MKTSAQRLGIAILMALTVVLILGFGCICGMGQLAVGAAHISHT